MLHFSIILPVASSYAGVGLREKFFLNSIEYQQYLNGGSVETSRRSSVAVGRLREASRVRRHIASRLQSIAALSYLGGGACTQKGVIVKAGEEISKAGKTDTMRF